MTDQATTADAPADAPATEPAPAEVTELPQIDLSKPGALELLVVDSGKQASQTAAEGDEPEAEPVGEPGDAEDQAGDEPAVDGETEGDGEETVTIRFNDEEYVVPKELKALEEGFMKNADYTAKTTELADQRRALEEQQVRFQEQAQAQQAAVVEYGQLALINQALEVYGNTDWATLQGQDPDSFQYHSLEYTKYRDQKAQLESQITQRNQTAAHDQQQNLAKQVEQTATVLREKIPNYSPELQSQVNDYARGQGITDQQIKLATANPAFAMVLHDGFIGRQLAEQARKAASPAPPTAKVVNKVKPRAARQTGPQDGEPIDSWMAKRNRQIAKANGQ